MLKNSKFIYNIFRIFILGICGAILGINLYSANASSVVGNKLPMPFGYGFATVLSGSMEPTLSIGDLIIVKENKNYDVNDIVVFQDDTVLVVHRIVEVLEEEVITKGDANNVCDGSISKESIKGEVMFDIPMVGTLINMIKTPVGTIFIIVVAIALMEIPRRKEKEKDAIERQKILDEINRLKKEL